MDGAEDGTSALDKPVALLDVDGPLNVLTQDRSLELHRLDGFSLHLPAGIRERVARLELVFDMAWATTWEDSIGAIAAIYGFGASWPVVPMLTMGPAQVPTIKLRPVRSWVDSEAHDRSLLWIDDELWADADEWARARDAPTKLVVPDAAIGLTDAEVDEAIAWADSLGSTRGG